MVIYICEGWLEGRPWVASPEKHQAPLYPLDPAMQGYPLQVMLSVPLISLNPVEGYMPCCEPPHMPLPTAFCLGRRAVDRVSRGDVDGYPKQVYQPRVARHSARLGMSTGLVSTTLIDGQLADCSRSTSHFESCAVHCRSGFVLEWKDVAPLIAYKFCILNYSCHPTTPHIPQNHPLRRRHP